ncbi:hypothetical protein [Bradyrhizobium sp. URHD0069]|uniref:hypothetical protein n=1 Tax=Bradyrhizobium sp. URHD0069 TaxID=1380355 RepID=UPI000A935A62|nr:hypothetical protein [Bradyrhizobium sp. URHD0069]
MGKVEHEQQPEFRRLIEDKDGEGGYDTVAEVRVHGVMVNATRDIVVPAKAGTHTP